MICTALKKISTLSDDTDVIQVTIDNDVEALMFFNYADSLKYLNQEVIVSYRSDVYEGKIQTFINTLTIPVKVNTLDRDENIKLFTEQHDNNSNVCFADLGDGDVMLNAIMYCVSCVYESSPKAVWVAIKVRDRAGRIKTLRLFDYDKDSVNYAGTYIKCDIKNTKYGLTTSYIAPMSLDFAPNPELDICQKYIQDYFATDNVFTNVLQTSKILDFMREQVVEELGYLIVRTAIELDILAELKNVFNDVDFTAISYAIVLSRGYVMKASVEGYSNRFKSYLSVLDARIPTITKKKVLLILDPEADNISEKRVYTKVVELADEVIRVKKE